MKRSTCTRCDSPLRDASLPCGLCLAERRQAAVRKLVAAAKSTSKPSLVARAEAISTLRSLGCSEERVLEARAQAVDGWSVDQILEGLTETTGAVAA